MDAQSIQNANTTEKNWYDAEKRYPTSTAILAVDTACLLYAIHVTIVNISDTAGAMEMVKNDQSSLFCAERLLCDSSYNGKPLAKVIKKILGDEVQVVKENEPHCLKFS